MANERERENEIFLEFQNLIIEVWLRYS